MNFGLKINLMEMIFFWGTYNMDKLEIIRDIIHTDFDSKNKAFVCPNCGRHNKFEVRNNTLQWHCWVCDFKGISIVSLIKRLKIYDKELYRQAIRFDKQHLNNIPDENENIEEKQEVLYLPDSININELSGILKNKPFNYIKSRNFDEQDIKVFDIRYNKNTKFIVVPSYDINNKLNYYITRNTDVNSYYRYKNPTVSKDVIIFENKLNFKHRMILVEGIFDAITLRRNTTALLGKTIMPKLLNKLIENNTEVVLFLDYDAKKQLIYNAKKLYEKGLDVYIVILDENKDVNDIGYDKAWQLINNAVKITDQNITKYEIILNF